METAAFLGDNPEDADLNQYWYSSYTIKQIVAELVEQGGRMAFLSTPSLYFSLPDELRSKCYVFDYDRKWDNDRGFVFYDFNAPEDIAEEHKEQYDLVIVDPPFITSEVWNKYAETVKYLLRGGNNDDGTKKGKVLATTIHENAPMMHGLFGVEPTAFLPSIPNLVYQYNLYTNFSSKIFSMKNPEIPE